MKKASVFILGIISLLLAVSQPAYAVQDTFYMYMTNADGSYATQTTFSPTETPYLYIHSAFYTDQVMASFWNDPAGTTNTANFGPSTTRDKWLTLDWNTVAKTPGQWTVNGYNFDNNFNLASGSTRFSITPEPISSTLFLLGAGALAARLRRKQKAA
jgi:hypothetical protein